MSSPFVAEIRIFGCNSAPTGWALCNGQLLPISQNTALFSLLGTFYGGDGKSTFALPNMQGNAPMFWGQGPGLSLYDLGQESGSQFVTRIQSEMPIHTHTYTASEETVNEATPVNFFFGAGETRYAPPAGLQIGGLNSLGGAITGGTLPHNNMMPYLTVNFCIALQGVFPPRS